MVRLDVFLITVCALVIIAVIDVIDDVANVDNGSSFVTTALPAVNTAAAAMSSGASFLPTKNILGPSKRRQR